MNFVDAYGGTKYERYLVEDAAHWSISKLMPRMRTLEIDIELKEIDDAEGLCHEVDRRQFVIEMQKGMEYEDFLTTLFHEMVHVKQHVRKEFEPVEYNTFEGYMAQPSEIEAYKMQRGAIMSMEDREPQRYYDWMLWKMRQEEQKDPRGDPLPIIEIDEQVTNMVKALKRIEEKIDLLLIKDQKLK